jgi:hypothetical protein
VIRVLNDVKLYVRHRDLIGNLSGLYVCMYVCVSVCECV